MFSVLVAMLDSGRNGEGKESRVGRYSTCTDVRAMMRYSGVGSLLLVTVITAFWAHK